MAAPSGLPPPPQYPVAPPAYLLPTGYPPPPTSWATFGPSDLAALREIRIAALIGLLGALVGFAVPLVLEGVYNVNAFAISSPKNVYAALDTIFGIAIAGIVVSIVGFWFYRRGFAHLRPIDVRFHSTPTWALLGVIGLALLIVVFLGFIGLLQGISNCTSLTGNSTVPAPSNCLNAAIVALALVVLLLVGAIIALIGVIGLLVGIYRLGGRFDQSTFKIGAILLILPFLSIVGQILILVATYSAEEKVRAAPGQLTGAVHRDF